MNPVDTGKSKAGPEVVALRAENARLRAELGRHEAAAERSTVITARARMHHRTEIAAERTTSAEARHAAKQATGEFHIERASIAPLRASPAHLATSQARLAAIVESASDIAILTADLNGRLTSWNKGAEKVLGWREDEVLGQLGHLIFTPEDRTAGQPEAEMATALGEGRAEDKRWHQRRDGSRFWASGLMMPLRDADGEGEPQGFLKILRDLTAEKHAQDEVREKAEFLERVLESSGDCIKVLGLDGRLEFMSAGGRALMEVDDFGSIEGCPWPEVWDGEAKAAARAALHEARAGRIGRFQGRALTARGAPKEWDVVVTPIRDAAGRPQRILAISRDVTDLRRTMDALQISEKRAQLLAGEMHHRVKNTLTMVQAIVSQSLRKASSTMEARVSIDARLQALGQAHDLLLADDWSGADLRGIVSGALRPHDDGVPGRFRIEGPPLALSAQAASALALTLHELATNAAKYGALSTDKGYVAISWTLSDVGMEGDQGGERLRFVWQERGGPPVARPGRRGFGSRLIERGLFGAMGETVRLAFEPAGVTCEIEVPKASLGVISQL